MSPSAEEFDIVAICKTNFIPDVNSGQYFSEKYVVFSKTRKLAVVMEQSGGVVLLAIKIIFSCEIVENEIGSLFSVG